MVLSKSKAFKVCQVLVYLKQLKDDVDVDRVYQLRPKPLPASCNHFTLQYTDLQKLLIQQKATEGLAIKDQMTPGRTRFVNTPRIAQEKMSTLHYYNLLVGPLR